MNFKLRMVGLQGETHRGKFAGELLKRSSEKYQVIYFVVVDKKEETVNFVASFCRADIFFLQAPIGACHTHQNLFGFVFA